MTFETIRKILSDYLEIDENEITLESDLVDDLGASSIDLVDLAMSVEDEFDIELPDELIETVQTVSDIVEFIDRNK